MNKTVATTSVIRPTRRNLAPAILTLAVLLAASRASVAQETINFSGLPGNGSGYIVKSLTSFAIYLSGGGFTGSEAGGISFTGNWTGSYSMWGIQGTTVPSAGHRDHAGFYFQIRHTPNGSDHPLSGNNYSISIEYPYAYWWQMGEHYSGMQHGADGWDSVYWRFSLTDVADPIHITNYSFSFDIYHMGRLSLAAPEPGPLALLALGIGVTGLVARHRLR